MAYNSWIRFLFWIMKISKYKNRFIKVCAWSSAGRPGYTKIKLLLLSILKGPPPLNCYFGVIGAYPATLWFFLIQIGG